MAQLLSSGETEGAPLEPVAQTLPLPEREDAPEKDGLAVGSAVAEAQADAEEGSVALRGAEPLAPAAVPESVPQADAVAQAVLLAHAEAHAVGIALADERSALPEKAADGVAAALEQALSVPESVPAAPLVVAQPLSVPQPEPLCTPLPLRAALPLPLPLPLTDGEGVAVGEVRGVCDSELCAVVLTESEAHPEDVGERVLLEDALPGGPVAVAQAELEAVAPLGGGDGVEDALPPGRAPPELPLPEAEAEREGSCVGEAVAEAQREEKGETEEDPEGVGVVLSRAETESGPLSVPLEEGLPVRLALREGS